MQKHKLLLSLLLLTITGIFTACTDDTANLGTQHGIPLDIQVGVNPQSRAVITGNSLPDGSQISVTVVDKTGAGYQEQDYNNVCYQAVTEDGSQKWKVQSRSDILLSGEAGTLYAYYPWTAATTDITQIAVNMDETDQKDWMVAQPITDLSDVQATAAIKMQHMLSNFKLAFYKDNYSGKGEVTNVTIRSNALATTGTLDATTGTFTAYGDGHALTRTFTTTLGTDKAAANACNVMVVPNTVNAPVTVSVTVDGNTYSSTIAALTLLKGKSYNYTMKLSSTGLSITEVTLTDWNTQDLGETEFKPFNPWKDLSDGVYAVSADNKPVNYTMADNTAVGVVLVAGEHKFMIAKANAAVGTNQSLRWGNDLDGVDVGGLVSNNKVDGTNRTGYLAGTSTPQLNKDYTMWTTGALAEFDGKTNTAAIIAAYSENGVEMGTYDMCTVLNTFNDSDKYNDWYVPALGQLALMYLNLSEINEALTQIGGKTLLTVNYWSSSEYSDIYAWRIDFLDGLVTYDYAKESSFNVRFVRDIVETNPQPQIISFSIGSTIYQAEKDMTWEDWVNSSYNTASFYITFENNFYLIKNEKGYIAVNGAAELNFDVIDTTKNYQLYGTVTLPSLEGD